MDVTAMLNTSTEADGQTNLEDAMRNPFQNRTPWDAGGYSLPIHAHNLGPFTDDAFPNDSLMDNHIAQRRHKLSDSHSSLSSLASSNSISHSRFSSMSTVSSLQLPSQTISEAIYTDSEASSHSSKTAAGSCSPVSPCTGRSTSQSSSSPTLYGNSLTSIAERHFYGYSRKESVDQIFIIAELAKVRSIDSVDGVIEGRVSTISPRPASPSDAILIKRNTPPVVTRLPTPPSVVERDFPHTYLHTPIQEDTVTAIVSHQQSGRLSVETRGHKRAISAPDFPGTMAESLPNTYKAPMSSDTNAELTRSSSQPKTSLPGVTALNTALNTPPEVVPSSQDRRPCCMYISNCDTGSTLRKAVSHIFGRNKMCTRRIPEHIWVWYCRKHYQRARYRNAKEWARTLQYDLVSRQIKRLQEWSEENSRSGEGGIVKDYRLAVRKREQKRLDSKKPKGEREASDSELDETSESQGDASSSTAVPDWLLSLCGKSHDTERIMEIIDGIQTDLTENNLSAWPDIEILPNIVLDQDESGTAKGYTRRRTVPGTHGRSQSLGSTVRFDEDSTGPWGSQASISLPDGQSLPGGISQKRKRSDDREEEDDVQATPQSQRIRLSERQVAAVRQGAHTDQQPMFRNYSEHQGAGECFEMQGENHSFATGAHNLLPAAPKPQRYTSVSTAAHINPRIPSPDGSSPVTRHNLHKRCYSDMDGLHSCQVPSRISAKHRPQSAGPVHYERPAPRRFFSPPTSYSPLSYAENPRQHQRAHMRHQSTPIVPLSIRCPVVLPASCRTLPRISSSSPSSSRDMIDSIKALDLYSARR